MQPADSLNLMFGYLDKKFEAMQNQIDQNIGNLRRKEQCITATVLKVQVILYNSNSMLEYEMILRTFLTTKISTSLIKIVDRSPAGWPTITEYEDGPFASDSEDSKKICQAEIEP